MFAPEASSTLAVRTEDNNNQLAQLWVGNEPSSSANAPRPMLVQSNEHDQYREVIPKQITEHDPTTFEFWVVFDERVHTRQDPNRKSNQSILPQISL